MRPTVLRLAAVLAPLLGTAACFGLDFDTDAVRGSGVAATDTRPLADFHRIEVGGSYDVVVTVGGPGRAIVTGDDNLVPLLRTEVRNGTLHIESDRSLRPARGDMVVEVMAPSLDAMRVAGASEASAAGVRSAAFDADVSGSGSLTVHGTFGDLSASVSGSGDLTMVGPATRVDARVSGSGDLDLLGVPARDVEVAVSGSGGAGVNATSTLEASVSGSGEVRYRGEPAVDANVSGSGSVRPAG